MNRRYVPYLAEKKTEEERIGEINFWTRGLGILMRK
jgi:hypothetical protein